MQAWTVVVIHIKFFAAIACMTYVVIVIRNGFEMFVLPHLVSLWNKGIQMRIARKACHPKSNEHWGRISHTAMLVVGLGLSCCFSVDAGENWPSFQNGGNTSVSVQDLPTEWSPEQGIAWEVATPGYGQSAPVIWKDQVFITSIEGEQKEECLISAYDLKTGNQNWQKTFPATTRKPNTYMASRAAPTPLTDHRGLYLFFESGDLISLTHQGEVRWQKAFFDEKENAFQNGHGYGASPTQTEEAVILLVDHKGPSYLTAISKSTGEPMWRTERTSRSSWSSPHVAQFENDSQIVVSSGGTVDGYDAETGKQLWTMEGVSGNSIPSVAIAGDRIYVGASESRGGTGPEAAAASNCCLQIKTGQSPGYEKLWAAKEAVCHYISPLVHQECVYYVNKVGVLCCVDARTGEQHYKVRMGEPCWAQPIAWEDRVYFFGKSGTTKIIQAGTEYVELGENLLWTEEEATAETAQNKPNEEGASRAPSMAYLDPLVYAVAAVDGRLIFRLGDRMYCVSNPTPAGQVQTTSTP